MMAGGMEATDIRTQGGPMGREWKAVRGLEIDLEELSKRLTFLVDGTRQGAGHALCSGFIPL